MGAQPGNQGGGSTSGYGANGVLVQEAAASLRGNWALAKAAVSRASGWALPHLPSN